jgi:hypothetical protein
LVVDIQAIPALKMIHMIVMQITLAGKLVRGTIHRQAGALQHAPKR